MSKLGSKLKRYIQVINMKTLYINFKCLSVRDAIKLPIFVSRRLFITDCSGTIEIRGKISRGMIELGFGNVGMFDKKKSRSVLELSGKLFLRAAQILGMAPSLLLVESWKLETIWL